MQTQNEILLQGEVRDLKRELGTANMWKTIFGFFLFILAVALLSKMG